MRRPSTSRWAVDVIGGGMVCACLTIGAWFAFGPPRQATGALQAKQTEATRMENEVAQTRSAIAAAQTRLDETRQKDEALGALPREMRLEKDLNTIAELARGHKLSLSQVVPESAIDYPGVREARYIIQGTGSFANWRAFLRSFETSPFWADITNLEMGTTRGSRPAGAAAPEVSLTISFYAATETPDGSREASTKK